MTIESQQHYIVKAEADGPTVCFSVQPPDDTLGDRVAVKVLAVLMDYTPDPDTEDQGDTDEAEGDHDPAAGMV